MKNSRRVVLIGAGAVVLGAFAGVASANTLGVNDGVLDVGSGSVAVPVCASGQVVMNSVQATYAANVYSVSKVNLSTLNANCRLDPYQIVVADNDTGFPALYEGSGTTPNATGLMTFGAAPVNDVNSTNNQVRVFMLVKN